jgi:hypothetical protein
MYTRDEVKELLRGKLGAADRELDELVDKLMKLAKNNTGVKL